MEDGPDHAQLGQADALLREVDRGPGGQAAAGGGEGIPSGFFPFEFGPAEVVRPAEEVKERLAQVLVDGAQGLAVHRPEKGGVLFVAGGGGNILQIRGGVELPRVGEHPVPEVPAAAEGLLHQRGLLRRGVQAELENGVPDCRGGFRSDVSRHGSVPPPLAGSKRCTFPNRRPPVRLHHYHRHYIPKDKCFF